VNSDTSPGSESPSLKPAAGRALGRKPHITVSNPKWLALQPILSDGAPAACFFRGFEVVKMIEGVNRQLAV
jgi:hypothetical protein